MEYLNTFFTKHNPYSKEYYVESDYYKIIEYKRYKICEYTDTQYHIIKDNKIVGMYAGINGAKSRVDSLIEERKNNL